MTSSTRTGGVSVTGVSRRGARRVALLGVAAGVVVGCATPRPITAPPPVIGAEERGLASWYGHPYHGRRTASGEVYDMHAMTAAHRSLPFDTWLHVENVDTGDSARVRVNDRGPFVDGRVLDVSRAAGVALGLIGPGVAPVRLRVIAAPPEAARPVADAGVFAVQVGAFTEETGALTLQRQLSEAGFETYVRRADDGGRVLYRVRAGRFTTRAEAAAHAEQIRARGHPTIVVSD